MRSIAMFAALVGLSSVAIAGDHYRPKVHVSSYTYDGVSTNYGYCVAVDADWNVASCYTEDPAQMAAIAAINASSYVLFSATDGVCSYVSTNNTSWTL